MPLSSGNHGAPQTRPSSETSFFDATREMFSSVGKSLKSFRRPNRFDSMAHLTGTPFLGVVPSMIKSNNGALETIKNAAVQADHHPSGMCYLWAGNHQVVVTSRIVLKQIFSEYNSHKLIRANGSLLHKYTGMNTLFFSASGEGKQREKRLAYKTHVYTSQAKLENYFEIMKDILQKTRDDFDTPGQNTSESFDLIAFATKIVIAVAQKALFGDRVDLNEASRTWLTFDQKAHWLIGTARGQVYDKIQSVLSYFGISTLFSQLLNAKMTLQRFMFQEYKNHKSATPSSEKTLIDSLEEIDPSTVESEIGFMLEALHQNTIIAFAVIMVLLHKNPEAKDKLIKELNSLSPNMEDWTIEQLEKLTYLECVIAEALRLCPTAPNQLRTVIEPVTLTDKRGIQTTLAVGDVIIIPTFHLQTSKINWNIPDQDQFEPDQFKPERFYNKKNPPMTSLNNMPFGAGSRQCIGKKFALQEIKFLLAYLLRFYQVQLDQNASLPKEWRIIMYFAESIQCTLTRLKPDAPSTTPAPLPPRPTLTT